MKLKQGIALLSASLLIATAGFFSYGDQSRKVELVSVERGDLQQVIRVTGEVINERSVILTALVDGQVNRVASVLGDLVKAGQILASMDNRAAAARTDRALAYQKQEAVRRREQLMRYQRLEKLASKGAVSQEALQDAKLNWQAATAAWQVAQAERRLAEVAQEWQQIHAPFDAVVVSKSTEVGQWVEAGTPLFSLAAHDGWEIEAHVDAVDSGRLRSGQPVTIRCDAFPDRVWQSKITWTGPSVEREKDKRLNTFRVRMDLGEEVPPLLLGQQVDVEILMARREGVLKLPFAALSEREDGFEVAMIESGRLRYRRVTTGLEGDSHVELLSGVTAGEKVVRLDAAAIEAGVLVSDEQAP